MKPQKKKVRTYALVYNLVNAIGTMARLVLERFFHSNSVSSDELDESVRRAVQSLSSVVMRFGEQVKLKFILITVVSIIALYCGLMTPIEAAKLSATAAATAIQFLVAIAYVAYLRNELAKPPRE
jgi:hypothetical protein